MLRSIFKTTEFGKKEISYDPYDLISKQKNKNKNAAYQPTPMPNLVSIANKDNWQEVQQILKKTTKSSEPEQILGQKREIDEMEIDEEDPSHQSKR